LGIPGLGLARQQGQVGTQGRHRLAVGREAAQHAGLVKEEDAGGVVQGVAHAGGGLAFCHQLQFLDEGGGSRGIAPQGQEGAPAMGGEGGYVVFEQGRGVPLRVQGGEEHLYPATAGGGQGFHGGLQFGQGGGADIRALAVTHGQGHHLAAEIGQATRLTLGIGELEIGAARQGGGGRLGLQAGGVGPGVAIRGASSARGSAGSEGA